MRTAKYFVLCLFIIASMLLPYAVSMQHRAEAAAIKYARADRKDVYFCERKDLKFSLFTIPYTYCVEILSDDGEWYYVKYAEDNDMYQAMYGYCLHEGLTPVKEPPENIYLNMPITVTFKADTVVGSLPVLGELKVTAAFYGTYYSGASAYSYVLYDGSFGYVYGANDNYPLNEIPEPDDDASAKPEPDGGDNKLLIGLALAGVAAAALIILYFTGRRSRYFRPEK